MKLAELLSQMQELDGSLEVFVSRDSEGNQFSPLHQLTIECMVRTARNFETGDGPNNAVVIWPTH